MSDSPEMSDAPNKPIGDIASPDVRPAAMTERFNVFFRFFARRYFKHFSLDEDVVERLKGLEARGSVVYVMRYSSRLDYFLFNALFLRHGLRLSNFANSIHFYYYRPFREFVPILIKLRRGRPREVEHSEDREMVREGHAWAYTKYAHSTAIIELEDHARAASKGLWALPENQREPPWIWRHPPRARKPKPGPLACGTRTYCSEMASCEEARFYFEKCGVHSLDGDGDGIPCESLCATAR